jgi:hypothetical protein
VTTAQKAGQVAGAPWWKNKYAAGAGIAAGAGAGGYYLGSQRQQQMSAWLDDVIQFERGHQYRKTLAETFQDMRKLNPGNPLTEFLARLKINVPVPPRGSPEAAEYARRLRIMRRAKELSTPKIFESAEEPIEFDDRSRDPEGRFIPSGGGGPDANAMATVYKMPQPGGVAKTVAQGSALAIAGGALGHIGGEIGKGATSKAKEILKRFKKMTPR